MFGEAKLGKLSCSDLFEAASLLGHLESENQKETSRSLLKQLSSCSRFFTFIFIVEKCPFSSKHNTRQITPSREAGSGGMDLEVGKSVTPLPRGDFLGASPFVPPRTQSGNLWLLQFTPLLCLPGSTSAGVVHTVPQPGGHGASLSSSICLRQSEAVLSLPHSDQSV